MLREHVLVMKFIGYDGFAAPRLKDAKLTLAQVFSTGHISSALATIARVSHMSLLSSST